MKGPIASALAAVAALRRAGLSLAGTLELHLVADEELSGIHGTRVLREQGMLDQDAARSWASRPRWRSPSPNAVAPGSRPSRTGRPRTARSRTGASTRS